MNRSRLWAAIVVCGMLLAGVAVLGPAGSRIAVAARLAAGAGRPAATTVPPAAPATTAPSVTVTPTTTAPATAAPATGPGGWVTATVALRHVGLARSFRVIRPAAATGRLPVVVMLSGRNVDPAEEDARDDFEAVTGPAIIVYPAPTGSGDSQSWNAGHCCQPAQSQGVDDVGFVEQVVATVLADHPDADPSRVYLSGYSNGGRLALTLACEDPQRWRAVAVYGATGVIDCPDQQPVNLLVSASTGDSSVTIDGGAPQTTPDGFVQPTIVGQAALARRAAGCPAAVTTTTEGSLTQRSSTCPDGRQVAVALWAGGDHTWPTGSGATPSGTALMWSWFARFGA